MINFDPALLGPFFYFPPSYTAGGGSPGGLIIPANASRVAFIITSTSASTSFISPVHVQPVSGQGLAMVAMTSQILTLSDLGTLVCQEWYCFPGAPITFWIQEIIFRPQGK